MTSHDRRAIRRYTFFTNLYQLRDRSVVMAYMHATVRRMQGRHIRRWWNGKGPWFHIFALAGLVCAFELALMWAVYPWLLDRVSVTL
jgi:hypothetical protein